MFSYIFFVKYTLNYLMMIFEEYYYKELTGVTTTTTTNLPATSVIGQKEHHYNSNFAPALFHPLFLI